MLDEETTSADAELGEAEVGADVGEGRERPLARDELRHEVEAFVEVTQDVEHQSAVLNGFAKIGKSVGHVLHLAAIVVDGERTLGESAKLCVENQARDSRLLRNCSSRPSQAARAETPSRLWMMSSKSVEMVLKSQDTTTQSMRDQAGSGR